MVVGQVPSSLGVGAGGKGDCGKGMLSHLENGISLDLHCSFQTFNKSFFLMSCHQITTPHPLHLPTFPIS